LAGKDDRQFSEIANFGEAKQWSGIEYHQVSLGSILKPTSSGKREVNSGVFQGNSASGEMRQRESRPTCNRNANRVFKGH
jgi:hypothetical protein